MPLCDGPKRSNPRLSVLTGSGWCRQRIVDSKYRWYSGPRWALVVETNAFVCFCRVRFAFPFPRLLFIDHSLSPDDLSNDAVGLCKPAAMRRICRMNNRSQDSKHGVPVQRTPIRSPGRCYYNSLELHFSSPLMFFFIISMSLWLFFFYSQHN